MISNPVSESGDIIFFSPVSNKSLNTSFQGLVRKRASLHSHVAVAVKQGNAIHAMPKRGVHVSRIRDLLLENKSTFRVYRNLSIGQDDSADLEDALWYFNRQRYNYRFFMASRSNASFCSELVVKAYRRIALKVSGNRASRTLPSDIFDYVSRRTEWKDVTEVYRGFFLSEDFDEGHNVASDFVNAIEQLNQNMSLGQQRLFDRLNAVMDERRSPQHLLAPARKYWNVTPRFRWRNTGKGDRR